MVARLAVSLGVLLLAVLGATCEWPEWARAVNVLLALGSLGFALATSPALREWTDGDREERHAQPRSPSWPYH